MLREHVLRHVRVWVVLCEKHHGAAEPWNRGQGRPPLPYKMSTLWVPQLIAPWIWRVIHVHGGNGIFYLGKDDRVNLVSWAGNNDVMDNGLAEGVNVGSGRQDREYKIPSNGSGRCQSRRDLWYK